MNRPTKSIYSDTCCDYLFNIVIIGDSGVGKSSLLLRFADDSFAESHVSTIGIDFKVRTVELDGKLCKLRLWDTSGQEKFRSITQSYYRGAHGVILVYDVTNQESLTNLDHWMKDVNRFAGNDVVKCMIGNKCDLSQTKAVGYEEAKAFADTQGIPVIETSALNRTNVDVAFMTLAADIKSKSYDGYEVLGIQRASDIKLEGEGATDLQGGSCSC